MKVLLAAAYRLRNSNANLATLLPSSPLPDYYGDRMTCTKEDREWEFASYRSSFRVAMGTRKLTICATSGGSNGENKHSLRSNRLSFGPA
jgi:hypothetical protein